MPYATGPGVRANNRVMKNISLNVVLKGVERLVIRHRRKELSASGARGAVPRFKVDLLLASKSLAKFERLPVAPTLGCAKLYNLGAALFDHRNEGIKVNGSD